MKAQEDAAALHFPEGFLWGSATAAYQVEGGLGILTDWGRAAYEGRVPDAGEACDFYHRYESDFDLAKSLHQNAFRISIEWARIEPRENTFDRGEIEHYRSVIRAIKKRGMTPMVTLWHFTLPVWFVDKGGFLSRDAVKLFTRYCEHVMRELGGESDLWITMNELEVYMGAGYMTGKWPPFRRNFFEYVWIFNRLIRAHKSSYRAMKKIRPTAQIGIAKHNIYFDSNWNPINLLLRLCASATWNEYLLYMIYGQLDFIGLNQYRRWKFGFSKKDWRTMKKSDIGWEVYPRSIYDCLMELKRYNLPIYVSENGISDEKDTMRADYIRETIRWMHKAISKGVPVKGYFHWSLIDNFEWAHGYTQHFGLVEVDRTTQERKVRSSAHVYAEICEANAIGG